MSVRKGLSKFSKLINYIKLYMYKNKIGKKKNALISFQTMNYKIKINF